MLLTFARLRPPRRAPDGFPRDWVLTLTERRFRNFVFLLHLIILMTLFARRAALETSDDDTTLAAASETLECLVELGF